MVFLVFLNRLGCRHKHLGNSIGRPHTGGDVRISFFSSANRFLLASAIFLELLAVLPVHHLLLMTADLAGARVLYLPVLGLTLFWACWFRALVPRSHETC